mmetsp:Transcript_39488/g.39942  ORF Transcript_39488/g.39942 Transcript_39488/m.39942 type:complete len:92 (+) Transcript_39488:2-277(+)
MKRHGMILVAITTTRATIPYRYDDRFATQSIRTNTAEAGEVTTKTVAMEVMIADRHVVANRSIIVTKSNSKQTTKIIGFSEDKYAEIAWNW